MVARELRRAHDEIKVSVVVDIARQCHRETEEGVLPSYLYAPTITSPS